MGQANAGQTVKSLRISATPDGKGLFFSMAQREKGGANTQLSVPLARHSFWLSRRCSLVLKQALSTCFPQTWGEFAAVRSLIDYSIPRCLGWDRALAETNIVPQ